MKPISEFFKGIVDKQQIDWFEFANKGYSTETKDEDGLRLVDHIILSEKPRNLMDLNKDKLWSVKDGKFYYGTTEASPKEYVRILTSTFRSPWIYSPMSLKNIDRDDFDKIIKNGYMQCRLNARESFQYLNSLCPNFEQAYFPLFGQTYGWKLIFRQQQENAEAEYVNSRTIFEDILVKKDYEKFNSLSDENKIIVLREKFSSRAVHAPDFLSFWNMLLENADLRIIEVALPIAYRLSNSPYGTGMIIKRGLRKEVYEFFVNAENNQYKFIFQDFSEFAKIKNSANKHSLEERVLKLERQVRELTKLITVEIPDVKRNQELWDDDWNC